MFMFFSRAWWAVGGTTPGAALISTFFLHPCLLPTSGASLSCVCILVRYQVEGVESKKENKEENTATSHESNAKGVGAWKGVHVYQSSTKILYG